MNEIHILVQPKNRWKRYFDEEQDSLINLESPAPFVSNGGAGSIGDYMYGFSSLIFLSNSHKNFLLPMYKQFSIKII